MNTADAVELRRICCAIMGELGTVCDHLGTITDTFHTPITPEQDARARAETLVSAEEAAGMLGVLADELVKEIHTHKLAEEEQASYLELANRSRADAAARKIRPAPLPLRRRLAKKGRAA